MSIHKKFKHLFDKYKGLLVFGFFIVYWIVSTIIWAGQLEADRKLLVNLVTDKLVASGYSYEEIQNHPEYLTVIQRTESERFWEYFDFPFFITIMILGVWSLYRSFSEKGKLSKLQRNFLMATSHELKSPLASIKLSLQTLLKRELPAQKRTVLLQNTLGDTERLQSLVENVILSTRFDSVDYRFLKNKVEFSNLVKDIFDSISFTYRNQRTFIDNIDEGLRLEGDRTSLSSMIWNLLENAVKYTAKGDFIEVRLKRENKWLILKVKDSGVGIPDKEKEKIFDKFYRIGNEDTRKTRGTGLGLYIIKEVIELHNGKVVVQNNIPKGTIFRIAIPENKLHISRFKDPPKEIQRTTEKSA